jgi:hypothetical protein
VGGSPWNLVTAACTTQEMLSMSYEIADQGGWGLNLCSTPDVSRNITHCSLRHPLRNVSACSWTGGSRELQGAASYGVGEGEHRRRSVGVRDPRP